ncbi:MAG: hypothetical protein H5U26_13760 [Immundisolibacter sp.]|uniref:hypothetical protein n=1 Tax=Immundisolibacter sp. TaxID=1934948 RepID=UPI0019AD7B8A|nr:hypothetical protein [Immundisolibacter sp.]MBC7163156.1 hypothetical protein [Immundisolibacter sp.]
MKLPQRLRRRQSRVAHTNAAAMVGSRPLDVWLQRIAHLTQVGLLLLGVFGYFYTVLPVFQNQQLEEQAARLEIEKADAQRRLDELLVEQQRVSRDTSLLRERWKKELERNAQLSTSASDARKQELLAIQRARDAERALQAQVKSLDSARWELVLLDVLRAYMLPSIKNFARDWSTHLEGSDLIRAEESEWPRPYVALVESVEVAKTMRGGDQVPASYYSELQAFIESRRSALQCTMPDFSGLAASYQMQRSALESTVEVETRANIEKLVKEYAYKGEEIRITDDYRESVRSSVRRGKVFELDAAFEKQLRDLRKSCDDKGIAVYEEFRRMKGIKH